MAPATFHQDDATQMLRTIADLRESIRHYRSSEELVEKLRRADADKINALEWELGRLKSAMP